MRSLLKRSKLSAGGSISCKNNLAQTKHYYSQFLILELLFLISWSEHKTWDKMIDKQLWSLNWLGSRASQVDGFWKYINKENHSSRDLSRDENNKIYFHKNSGRGLGSQEKRWLDLGTIPNLLIKTVGQIIRAENNVLIGGEGSGLGQGGWWHCNWSFLDDGRGRVQGILRLLLGLSKNRWNFLVFQSMLPFFQM